MSKKALKSIKSALKDGDDERALSESTELLKSLAKTDPEAAET
jgi:hypothetical protein